MPHSSAFLASLRPARTASRGRSSASVPLSLPGTESSPSSAAAFLARRPSEDPLFRVSGF